jgi:micrococcal nuclease
MYPSKVDKVYDGDTITISVDLGMGITKIERIRMYGINAPEMRGSEKAAGTKSRDALRKLILGKEVRLETQKKDKRGKYGRLLGTIYLGDINVNKWMVDKGYAKYKKY